IHHPRRAGLRGADPQGPSGAGRSGRQPRPGDPHRRRSRDRQAEGTVMYLRHFALREAPFSITPDSSFFYPHEGAQAALNTLLVALRSGEGFLKIVGEGGCGKTVLCRQLLKTLQGEFVTAYIPNPDMGPDDLLMAL